MPVSELAGCIRATKALLAGSPATATIIGHVGDGNFHVVFAVDPAAAADISEVERLNGEIVGLAIVATGDADLVAVARTVLYDPRWPWHAAAALGASIRVPDQYLRSQPRRLSGLFTSG
ncbi:hypothetical protein KL86PLE_40168 [uncultured Pleomorphomonas sp.]|uniref:FAD-binding oxidoreductase/transferase type 4 C-terminal domain-containing protein n=1 Tax=uncultured Pleomorphomonas sp. TaxID=442121 RepID=A0A212LFM1_9HYPH|nr:hypothetical protein KL86PLE_40168 [uncultured Pleomorphomonas sp.]